MVKAEEPQQDDIIEQEIFKPREGEQFLVNYQQTFLSPPGMADQKPWSEMDQELRDQVDGLMTLKMTFTAEDLALFPQLKVYIPSFPKQIHLGI